ncbi:dehydrodolichyl diphosphate synthase complex subunit DHDDS-like [Penaeus japonicus]|uniref:dehydrodolichyl diphosphate synthase complex subunit DHDDS-like n=1 Tax=Penaeus japonicus TaxID=27405 RepID=UPI001C717186|nr:dehydrodolichyl diphosphate synthase complex subunit DHDDS-like [Penaeus japonicus]XP_042863348.1 dehydrodolichyl diphosphate synthase complex subunit DHDDS-like [Penaeus japonicus]XP_042863349.1 dehydrodolichyl diphosphate synthase complex subunit DHDDS-like [Penaeus japonicus]XP_042863350.1 dehydrodolichyl diphosphate synthase complex subunit DHDDS-like [Penaeus japonicus]
MTWLVEKNRSWAEWAVTRILRVGPVPRHLAVIMDGNRRFARKEHQNTLTGHTRGFHKLTEVLSWCRDLGINEVTAYAFSIENFKRSKQEVDGLMDLAAEKLAELLEEKEKLSKHGVCIRILGNLTLLPERIQRLGAEAVLTTKNNDKCFLNLAIAYTSREEMSTAVGELCRGVSEGQIQGSDISEELLEKCLYTRGTPDPDLLIRTSGEVRLSDFLLWQSGFACMFFTKVLWPELTIWHLFGAIFYYQRHYHTLAEARRESLNVRQRMVEESDIEVCHTKFGEKVTAEHIAAQSLSRTERTDAFLEDLNKRTVSYLKEVCNKCE